MYVQYYIYAYILGGPENFQPYAGVRYGWFQEENGIIGRAFVVHANEDDLGMGGEQKTRSKVLRS